MPTRTIQPRLRTEKTSAINTQYLRVVLVDQLRFESGTPGASWIINEACVGYRLEKEGRPYWSAIAVHAMRHGIEASSDFD